MQSKYILTTRVTATFCLSNHIASYGGATVGFLTETRACVLFHVVSQS